LASSSGIFTKLPLALRQSLEKGECVLFIGAGIGSHYKRSDGTAVPDAKQLASDLIKHFKLNIDPSTDLVRVAQLVEIRASREELDTFIKKALANIEPDEHVQWLTTFKWRSIFTTNYDMGLERAYSLEEKAAQKPIPISVTSDLIYTDSYTEVPIFHLHGTPYEPCPSPIVITQSDYTRYQENRAMVWERLKYDSATSTILYIGYSGRDPNWQLIIEEVAREFLPSKPPISYRIDPFADPIDVEIHREARRVETLVVSLPEFHAVAQQEIGDYRPALDTLNKYRNRIPQHLRSEYDKAPAAMLRLLESWEYVNDVNATTEPNTKEFLRGTRANWSLIAQNHRFVRDIEDDVWERVIEFATNPKAKSTAFVLTGPAGYGITTIVMAMALRIVEAKQGPVFLLKEGAEIKEADVAYAANLFPEVACFFLIDQAREHVSRIQNALVQQSNTDHNCLFILAERRNQWLSANVKFRTEEFDVIPLSDGEINGLLDFLSAEGALGAMEELDRSFQFSIVKNKHEQQLLVAMREATEGEGAGFDAIIENEYRGINARGGSPYAKNLYLLVCCFYQHAMLIRDQLFETVLEMPLQTLHEEVGTSLEGLVEYVETDFERGLYAARARHRIIAEIVWKKCGTRSMKETLLQKAMEKLNLTYRLDKSVFELFIKSDEIVDTFSTLEGKMKFFETASRRDPNNVFVLQHYARMLLRERKLSLALTQIDNAIANDRTKSIRSLHHTRGLILMQMAIEEENDDFARKRLVQAEREFLQCIASKESDDYGHSGLANLYIGWSRRPRISTEEANEYLEKAEDVVSRALKVVGVRTSLLITSAEIQRDFGNQPERISKLREAVDSNKASEIGRYLLGRAYRDEGHPQKTMEVLDPIIKSDFKNVRAYVEYTRAMLDVGEPIRKCAATLVQCRLDGERDAGFVGLLGGLFYMDGNFVEATKLWVAAKEHSFSFEERTKRQFTPRDPGTGGRTRVEGLVEVVKPGYILVQPEKGPVILSKTTILNGANLKEKQKVSFELTFSAKGPLAENLKLA
jgi:cold shock CspA family protein